jgi:hypothetical protein
MPRQDPVLLKKLSHYLFSVFYFSSLFLSEMGP